MNYQETIDYLYRSLPVFQRIGAAAYKANLNNTLELDHALGHPHESFKTIHIAGTNGKGSTSQMIYSVLRAQGYRVGLYTSPHLKDFRERILVDDTMIEQEAVVDFVAQNHDLLERIKPSFFEMTVAMAFDYFRAQKVDIAVIEVGMGGRLDSTNIITPLLSVVTNIDFDHTQFLGDTLPKIAAEKAGIIKHQVPVVVGESRVEYNSVFREKAKVEESEIIFADQILNCTLQSGNKFSVLDNRTHQTRQYTLGMEGGYQSRNLCTALAALERLGKIIDLTPQAIDLGLRSAVVKGRWQILAQNPLTICDTGHNTAGLSWVTAQISKQRYEKLYFVIGVVSDKDVESILPLLPKDCYYIFTQAAIERAMPYEKLAQKCLDFGLQGQSAPTVRQAIQMAQKIATPKDMIFIGGSTFTVADAL